jgi:hypothetical protein
MGNRFLIPIGKAVCHFAAIVGKVKQFVSIWVISLTFINQAMHMKIWVWILGSKPKKGLDRLIFRDPI